MKDLIFKELDTAFLFNTRPESIPADLRPLWRISLILLILRIASRGGKSSFSRLHLLNWSLIATTNYETLKEIIKGNMQPQVAVVRIDPAVSYAVDFAVGEGLMKKENGNHIALTEAGSKKADILIKTSGAFEIEKRILNEFGKTINEKFVNKIFWGKE